MLAHAHITPATCRLVVLLVALSFTWLLYSLPFFSLAARAPSLTSDTSHRTPESRRPLARSMCACVYTCTADAITHRRPNGHCNAPKNFRPLNTYRLVISLLLSYRAHFFRNTENQRGDGIKMKEVHAQLQVARSKQEKIGERKDIPGEKPLRR